MKTPDKPSESTEKRRFYGALAKIGLVWGLVREGGNSLLLLPSAIILARLLSPEEMGIAAAAFFFMSLCTRLTQFGFGVSLVRTKDLTPDHVSSVFVSSLAMGLVAWAALRLGAPAAGAFLRSADAAAILPVAAWTFLIMPFGTVPTALLSRDMRYRDSSSSDWFATFIESATAIVLAWNGWSYWSLVYGRLAGDGSRALCRAGMTRWRPRLRFYAAAMRDTFSFGVGVYAKNLLDFTAQNVDNLIVGRVLGMTALGFYDKAFQTMHRFTMRIAIGGPSVSFRIFALIHEDPERFRRAYRKVILSITLLGFPIITGMIIAAPQLIEVLFGRQWLPAVLPFQILCVAAYGRLLNSYASTATQAKGQIWSEVRRQALFSAVLIGAVWALAHYGVAGAALGVLLATCAMTAMLQALILRLSGMTWRDLVEPQLPGVICSAGLAVVVVLSQAAIYAIGDPGALVVLAVSAAAGGLFVLAFLLWVPITEVRLVVEESVADLVPQLSKWLPRRISKNAAPASV